MKQFIGISTQASERKDLLSLHQNICSRNQPCPVLDSPSLMWGGSCGIGRVARDPECSTAPSPAPQTPQSHPDSPECHCPHLQPGKGLCSPGALTQRVQGQGEMWGSARLGAQPPLGHSRVRALSFPSCVLRQAQMELDGRGGCSPSFGISQCCLQL